MDFTVFFVKDTHRERDRQIKLQRLEKVRTWAFELLVHYL